MAEPGHTDAAIRELLETDCRKCTGLCCIYSGFSAGADFAIDKPAGTHCPNLTDTNKCSIHSNLKQSGFSGCSVFDCNGAGPWLLQALTAANMPRNDVNMINMFRAARDIRRSLELVYIAGTLALPKPQLAERHRLLSNLTPAITRAFHLIRTYESSPLPGEINLFLKSLRPLILAVPPPGSG